MFFVLSEAGPGQKIFAPGAKYKKLKIAINERNLSKKKEVIHSRHEPPSAMVPGAFAPVFLLLAV